MVKNSQPFGKNFQKTLVGIFFDSHCIFFVLKCNFVPYIFVQFIDIIQLHCLISVAKSFHTQFLFWFIVSRCGVVLTHLVLVVVVLTLVCDTKDPLNQTKKSRYNGGGGVPRRQPHRLSRLATLPSVGAVPQSVVTLYYCRLGDLLCFVFIMSLIYFFLLTVYSVCSFSTLILLVGSSDLLKLSPI